jgi:hypothetical protein
MPKAREKIVFDTDISNIGLGGVLSQAQRDQFLVGVYISRILPKAPQKYCINQRELLCVDKTVEHFRTYIYGQEFHQ